MLTSRLFRCEEDRGIAPEIEGMWRLYHDISFYSPFKAAVVLRDK